MVNNNLRYISWSAAEATPKTLPATSIPASKKSDCLFARRMTFHTTKEMTDAIDAFTRFNATA